MPLPAGNAGAAQGHALVQQAVVSNFRRSSHHNAGAVVNDQAAANGGGGVDLHPGDPLGMLGHPAGQKTAVMAVEPVGNAVIDGRMQAVVQEKNLQRRPGSGVVFLIGANGFA